MRVKKKIVSRVLIMAETIAFLAFYCWGSEGFTMLNKLRDENKQLSRDIESLETEVASLDTELVRFAQDPFFREKVAREQLQMAGQNEEILFIKETA